MQGPFFLCRGRGPERGKYRGVVQRADATSPDDKSVFWGKDEIEVVLPESAYLECQSDPEIVIIKDREVDAETAAQTLKVDLATPEIPGLPRGAVVLSQRQQREIDDRISSAADDALEARDAARRARDEAEAARAQAEAAAKAEAAARAENERLRAEFEAFKKAQAQPKADAAKADATAKADAKADADAPADAKAKAKG